MKTKDLVVAYKNRDWHRFDELSKEQLADIYILYIYCRTQFGKTYVCFCLRQELFFEIIPNHSTLNTLRL